MLATANLLVPNATALVEIAVFAAVLGIVARFVLPPLKAAMDQRQAEIRSSIEAGRRGEHLLAAAEAECNAKLDQARREASAIVETGRSIGAHLEAESRQRAKEEHDRIVARARWDIDRALAVARERLHDEAKRLHVDEPPSLDLVGEHVK